MKKCAKCGLQLPPDHRKKYCVGPRHACWSNDMLNKWRLENNIVTYEDLQQSFFGSISQRIVMENGKTHVHSGYPH